MEKGRKNVNFRMEMEEAVRARDAKRVRDLTESFLRRNRRSIESRIAVAEAFRRMGWFREGYRVVEPDRWSIQPVPTSTPRGAQQLTCARFVNLLGGTALAVTMLTRIRPESAKDHRIVANIHLSAYRYELALDAFRESIHREEDPNLYECKLAAIGEADCLAHLGRVDQALRRLDRIPINANQEALLAGIIEQARGEYLCLAERWKEAEASLQRALPFFPDADSPDHGFLYKWWGYAQARRGQVQEARRSFDRALAILKRPAIRAETWLDTYRLMALVDLLPPQHQSVLRTYPGLSPGFVSSLPPLVPHKDDGHADFWISEPRGEWRWRKKRFIGLPKEILLLSLLKRAGPHGIGMTRLESLIWPEDIGSVPLLDQRLYLLLNRLKRVYRISARVTEREVRLTDDALARIEIEFSPAPLPLTLFENHPQLSSQDFREAYSLGKAQAAVHLRSALARGEIERIPGSSGPTTRYRIKTEGPGE